MLSYITKTNLEYWASHFIIHSTNSFEKMQADACSCLTLSDSFEKRKSRQILADASLILFVLKQHVPILSQVISSFSVTLSLVRLKTLTQWLSEEVYFFNMLVHSKKCSFTVLTEVILNSLFFPPSSHIPSTDLWYTPTSVLMLEK